MKVRPPVRILSLMVLCVVAACARETPHSTAEQNDSPQCYSGPMDSVADVSGAAYVFRSDPMTASNGKLISPLSTRLDDYRTWVELSNLGGRGVLEGRYVDVRTGDCPGTGLGGFGVHDSANQFTYSHREPGFQQAMSYYYADRYRSFLDQVGSLEPKEPVRILTQCMKQDNAFYTRIRDRDGQILDLVCMGDSARTKGASYSDDAVVTIHELQHATTVNTYGLTSRLNQFRYDEAGVLNEGLSDFMALMFTAPEVPNGLDRRVFSRWALGTFLPFRGNRGVHRCPEYDPRYPICGAAGVSVGDRFSAESNRITYTYPDGLGWPYPRSYVGPGYVRSAFESHGHEEIHYGGIIPAGALWDYFEAISGLGTRSELDVRDWLTRLIHQAVKRLPKPDVTSRSPVTLKEFFELLRSELVNSGASGVEISEYDRLMADRGVLGGATMGAGWAIVGPGTPETPGMRVEDSPDLLKIWLLEQGMDPSIVEHDIRSGINARLNRGEAAAIWFDIGNQSAVSAGGLLLRIRSLNSDVKIFGNDYNDGAISDAEAQIRYFKVNGQEIVKALKSDQEIYHVNTGSTYFRTNPEYFRGSKTAVWIQVAKDAKTDVKAAFEIRLEPTNGPAETLVFETEIFP